MTTNMEWVHVDPEHPLHTLNHEAVDRVNGIADELVLDFGAVRRIDPGVVQAMEALSQLAEARSVKIMLQGINSAIYKVLKLLKLDRKFSFQT